MVILIQKIFVPVLSKSFVFLATTNRILTTDLSMCTVKGTSKSRIL
jgi:hypothetical protein